MIEERKKKIKKIKKLKYENEQTMQMVDGMKEQCEEKLRANEIELEKGKDNSSWRIVLHRNGDERGMQQRNREGKHEKIINTMKINYN